MRKFIKPTVMFPILFGTVIGAALYVLGELDDAPGLCLIGITTTFLLILWGIYNAKAIEKAFISPIVLLFGGSGGILLAIAWLLDSEFAQVPALPITVLVLSIIFAGAGALTLRCRSRQKQ